ncbi:MAG TPA: hypothetical protein VGI63_02050 [Verrucomicrobiae bacterium]
MAAVAMIEFLRAPNETPRILIVDDDSGQRRLLDSFLCSQGFDTVLAVSGEWPVEILPPSAALQITAAPTAGVLV